MNTRQAQLPLKYCQTPSKEYPIAIGESVWVAPRAILVDQDRRIWIEIDSLIKRHILGTFGVKITRTKKGLIADFSEMRKRKWTPEAINLDECEPIIKAVGL